MLDRAVSGKAEDTGVLRTFSTALPAVFADSLSSVGKACLAGGRTLIGIGLDMAHRPNSRSALF